MAVKGSTEIKVGFFVFIGILAILYLTFKLGEEAFTPKDSYKLYAVFENVSGLAKGAKIEMAGVNIGKVGNIELTPEGKAKVELLIYSKYKVQEDAEAYVKTYGVLGDKFVELKPGFSKNYLKPESMIANAHSAVSVDDLLANIGPTVEGLKELLGTEEGRQNLKILVANIKEASESFKGIAAKIEKGQGSLGKLVTDDSLYVNLKETTEHLKAIARQIESGQGTLTQTVAHLEKVSKKLEKGEGTLGKLINDESLYKELKQISTNLKEITVRIERGEGTLGKLLKDDSLYVEAKKTLRSVNRAAKGIEEQVPISVMGTVAGAAMK
ncbi:MAG: Mammalian cell entry related domain protein [Thermodesulfobacterium commune]|uniref:Mammalian cell entry protein n=2 Tax=Thermodesulfobacterium commune TaxID=1741 RepID=A0A101FI92_9BACT|nr:MAG: Mammalian cell entry related domain protein [Thermodesulfobacterium commune]HAA84484.1 mammalian cell entry protein [Thermodesulfobacterium commune]